MITDRQEKLLEFLVIEYLNTSEPVSSKALKKSSSLDCCEATIRNDLQELCEKGYIIQPHTSAGRMPTEKAYKHLAEKLEKERQNDLNEFIMRQINFAHEEMNSQMRMMTEIMGKLEDGNMFDILNILDKWHKR